MPRNTCLPATTVGSMVLLLVVGEARLSLSYSNTTKRMRIDYKKRKQTFRNSSKNLNLRNLIMYGSVKLVCNKMCKKRKQMETELGSNYESGRLYQIKVHLRSNIYNLPMLRTTIEQDLYTGMTCYSTLHCPFYFLSGVGVSTYHLTFANFCQSSNLTLCKPPSTLSRTYTNPTGWRDINLIASRLVSVANSRADRVRPMGTRSGNGVWCGSLIACL